MILLHHFLPVFIQFVTSFAPFLILLLQPFQDHRDGSRGILAQHLENLFAVVAVDAGNRIQVDGAELSLLELEAVPRSIGVSLSANLLQAENLLRQGLEDADRAHVGVDDHVDLESLVLAFEKSLFILVLSHVLERVTFFGTDRDTHPLGKRATT